MTTKKYTIVIAVFNNIDYTKKVLNCLANDDLSNIHVIIINNGSTDSTKEVLKNYKEFEIIHNEKNLGCAPAWNQGVRLSQSEWTVILNNDVLLTKKCFQTLGNYAEKKGIDIISPAFREGHYTTNFFKYANLYTQSMQHATRKNVANGICFMVRKKVWDRIGLFDENFIIGQFEDADFFWRARKAGFKLATSGCVLVQHFGSITQKSIKKVTEPEYIIKNRAYYRKKWKLNWLKRRLEKFTESIFLYFWRRTEYLKFKHTLFEKLDGDSIKYK